MLLIGISVFSKKIVPYVIYMLALCREYIFLITSSRLVPVFSLNGVFRLIEGPYFKLLQFIKLLFMVSIFFVLFKKSLFTQN